jgi:APA family basic amino acid/polyamine antiporter
MVPMKAIDLDAPLATAFVTRGLNFAAGIISVGAVAGLTSVMLVLLLGQSRIFYAISRDGLLPPAFSRIHPKYKTPSMPTVLTGVAVGLTASLVPIKEIAELTNIGTLFAFVLVCLGVWILRSVEPGMKRPFKTPLVPIVPILGAASCVLMMLGLGETTWLRFFIWLALGLLIYFTYGRFHSVVNEHRQDRGRAALS